MTQGITGKDHRLYLNSQRQQQAKALYIKIYTKKVL